MGDALNAETTENHVLSESRSDRFESPPEPLRVSENKSFLERRIMVDDLEESPYIEAPKARSSSQNEDSCIDEPVFRKKKY